MVYKLLFNSRNIENCIRCKVDINGRLYDIFLIWDCWIICEKRMHTVSSEVFCSHTNIWNIPSSTYRCTHLTTHISAYVHTTPMHIHTHMHMCTHNNFHTYTCHKHVHVQSVWVTWYKCRQDIDTDFYVYFCVCTTVRWYRCQHIHGCIIMLKSEN